VFIKHCPVLLLSKELLGSILKNKEKSAFFAANQTSAGFLPLLWLISNQINLGWPLTSLPLTSRDQKRMFMVTTLGAIKALL
jgi:hypothetical protein